MVALHSLAHRAVVTLADRIGGDEELLVDLIDLYMDDYPDKLRAISKALEAGDTEGLKKAAHGLKGASANLSFISVFEMTKNLEEAGSNNKLEFIRHKAIEWYETKCKMQDILNKVRESIK